MTCPRCGNGEVEYISAATTDGRVRCLNCGYVFMEYRWVVVACSNDFEEEESE